MALDSMLEPAASIPAGNSSGNGAAEPPFAHERPFKYEKALPQPSDAAGLTG